MAKLATADHVAAIMAVLSDDGWLADLMWSHDRDRRAVMEVTLPDRATRSAGGLVMIEVAPKDYVPTGEPLYPDRETWDKRNAAGYAPPFLKTQFKRKAKKKVDGEIRRVFDTPAIGLDAVTYEKGDAIVRLEFNCRDVFQLGVEKGVIRTVLAADIPEIVKPDTTTPLPYDVVDPETLVAKITATALDWLVDSEEYGSHQEAIEDYDRDGSGVFPLDDALHVGWPLSRTVETDAAEVDFSTENVDTEDFDAPGFQGVNAIGDLTFLGVRAGGDWESPIVFVLYLAAGELRLHIPDDGNHYDRRHLRAWGNGDESEEDDMEAADRAGWDVEALRAGIARRFGIQTS